MRGRRIALGDGAVQIRAFLNVGNSEQFCIIVFVLFYPAGDAYQWHRARELCIRPEFSNQSRSSQSRDRRRYASTVPVVTDAN